MKFRVEVKGKDSVSEGVSKAVEAKLWAEGVEYPPSDTNAWDELFEAETERLNVLVNKFVKDGQGGNDSVVVEFDTIARTCVVVPVSVDKPLRGGKIGR